MIQHIIIRSRACNPRRRRSRDRSAFSASDECCIPHHHSRAGGGICASVQDPSKAAAAKDSRLGGNDGDSRLAGDVERFRAVAYDIVRFTGTAKGKPFDQFPANVSGLVKPRRVESNPASLVPCVCRGALGRRSGCALQTQQPRRCHVINARETLDTHRADRPGRSDRW